MRVTLASYDRDVNPFSMEIREARRVVSSVGEKLIVVRESIESWSVWSYVEGASQRIGELRSDPRAAAPWASLVRGVEQRWSSWRDACDFIGARPA